MIKKRYHCSFKLEDSTSPYNFSCEAEHPGVAIQKMLSVAKVTSTIQLSEAQILECRRNQKGKIDYIVVFTKEPNKRKGEIVIDQTGPGSSSSLPMVAVSPAPIINTAVVEKQLDVYTRPYQIEVM